ncbi:exopolysaccharide biosynthesis polyprenyl glycosylphosphotransferase [Allobranchiibius huperziae]|uniref:Exopolysaccharide biosynthesis polyprenyl glycosylphosphotransferase n=1 Tax=Allobranchiibius huperziae TaxID=1874116 RepID=A0A853DL56_9MICO|nr:exopolysaccharide biosynthesis polyprenyl glycosylphosphotransferase [Allobranchiibius huperziae]
MSAQLEIAEGHPVKEPVFVEASRWRPRFVVTAVGVDALAIAVALVSAKLLRFGNGSQALSGTSHATYLTVAISLLCAWMAALAFTQSYRPEHATIGNEAYLRVVRSSFFIFGVLAMVALALRLQFARGYIAIAFPLGVALLILGRFAIRVWLVHSRDAGRCMDTVLVVGAPQEVRYVADRIGRTPEAGFVISGVVTGADRAGTFELRDGNLVPDAGAVDNALATALAHDVSAIIIAGHAQVSDTYLRELGWSLERTGIGMVLANRMTDVAGPRIHRTPVEGLPLMSVEAPRYDGGRYLLKRIFDVVVSGLLLVVTSPLFAVIALLIKLDDHGPVLFRQDRVGVNGETFAMTKFRSMVVDAESRLDGLAPDAGLAHPLFKMRQDPRVTRVGRALRAYSLDELPQLLDVFAGNMSMVGPRPALTREVSVYRDNAHRRLNVKPGITGPWQVGGRSNLSWEDSIRKDLYYVENWTLVGDCLLLVKTVKAVLTRDGAF